MRKQEKFSKKASGRTVIYILKDEDLERAVKFAR